MRERRMLRRTLLAALAWLALVAAGHAQSVVGPTGSMSPATSLTSAYSYLAVPGSTSDQYYGFNTTTFGIAGGVLVINNNGIAIGTQVSGLGSGVGSALGSVLNSSTGVIGDLTPTLNNCVVGNGTAWVSSTCPGGGSTAFSALTTGTNTSATMTVGAGGTITFSSTGIVNANEIAGTAISLGTLTTGDFCTVTTGSPNVLNCNSSGVGGTISITDTNSDSATGVSTISLGAGLATVTGSSGTSPINLTETLNTQSGTGAYAIQSTDGAKIILRTNASGGADTIVAGSNTGFTTGYGTSYCTGAFAGNTITPTTSTINGLSSLTLGANQCIDIFSDSTNYHAPLGVAQPSTQTGTTYYRDDFTWHKIPNTLGSAGWLSGANPDQGIILADVPQAETITAVNANLTALAGGTASIDIYDIASGTATCQNGTKVNTTSFNANTAAGTPQTLLSGTYALASGHSLCIHSSTWPGSPTSIATISVFGAPS